MIEPAITILDAVHLIWLWITVCGAVMWLTIKLAT